MNVNEIEIIAKNKYAHIKRAAMLQYGTYKMSSYAHIKRAAMLQCGTFLQPRLY